MNLNKIIALEKLFVSDSFTVKNKIIKIQEDDAAYIINGCLDAIKKYLPDYARLPHELLFTRLTDPERMVNRACPRIEIHRALNNDIVGIFLAIQPQYRNDVVEEIKNKLHIHATTPGRSMVEICLNNIDKSLPLNYLNVNYHKILEAMNYRSLPEFIIDAKKHKTLIIADGDGTIYDSPLTDTKNGLLLNNLNNSEAKEPLLNYLEKGGVFAICTGSYIQATAQRLLAAIPKEKIALASRIILISTAGATLNFFNDKGELIEYEPYRKEALNIDKANSSDAYKLDAVYFGDDHNEGGNDLPAFKAIGFDRAILVSPSRKIPRGLEKNHIGKNQKGTAAFIKTAMQNAEKNHAKHCSLFSPEQINKYVEQTREELRY